VVPKNAYARPQATTRSSRPRSAERDRLAVAVQQAKQAIEDGYAGSALKLGHDLWTYRDLAEPAHDLLERAYSALGRKVLRDYLKRVSSFRKRSESIR
jgi:hypothetical protein